MVIVARMVFFLKKNKYLLFSLIKLHSKKEKTTHPLFPLYNIDQAMNQTHKKESNILSTVNLLDCNT